jgi:hypothetical protein
MTEFALDADRIAIFEMARSFADDKMAPHALEWDQNKHFPIDGRWWLCDESVRRGIDIRGARYGLPSGFCFRLYSQYVRLND